MTIPARTRCSFTQAFEYVGGSDGWDGFQVWKVVF